MTLFPTHLDQRASPTPTSCCVPDMITDSAGNPGVARLQPGRPGRAEPRCAIRSSPARRSTATRASTARTGRCPTPGRGASASARSCSDSTAAVGRLRRQRVARPARRRRHQRAGQRRAARAWPCSTRPGRSFPAEARGVELPARAADADQRRLRRRLQVAAGVAGQAHGQPLERPPGLHAAAAATTSALGNPDARRVWLDNDIRAPTTASSSPTARNVLAASGTLEPVALAHHRHGGQRHHAARRSTRPSAATSTATSTTTTGRSSGIDDLTRPDSCRSSTRRAAP